MTPTQLAIEMVGWGILLTILGYAAFADDILAWFQRRDEDA